MTDKSVWRGKSRRVSAPLSSSESTEPTWNEAILSYGSGCASQTSWKDSDLSASDLLELHRRCFSCCSMVLQQPASVLGEESMTLAGQTKFTGHPLMKAIMDRVSEQGYLEIGAFVADFTRLVETCVAERDRKELLDVLADHVEKTGQADSRRPSKATFHGFPHPLVEEMMSQTASARKKLPPGGVAHVAVDIGRYLAQAYGLGLSKGARFCGEPSQEKAFHAQRKKRVIDAANNVVVKVVTPAPKAQQPKTKVVEKHVDETKKRQKPQLTPPTPAVTPKPTRNLRVTRRHSGEDGLGIRSSSDSNATPRNENFRTVTPASVTPRIVTPLFDTPVHEAPLHGTRHSGLQQKTVRQRIRKRLKVHCHHLQGKMIEMFDPETKGNGYTGTLQGTNIACLCGCAATISGTRWLIHNGGRSNTRQPGYPYRYMRIYETKEGLVSHYESCTCNEHLCDTCNSWEVPGAPMVECFVCRTAVHSTEECAIRVTLARGEALAMGLVTGHFADGTTTPEPRCNEEREGPTAVSEEQSAKTTEISRTRDTQGNGGSSSSAILAWRRPVDGDVPSSAGAVTRSRPARRRASAPATSDANGSYVSVEGESVGGGSSCSGSVDGGDSSAEGGRREAGDEVVLWKCQICAWPSYGGF